MIPVEVVAAQAVEIPPPAGTLGQGQFVDAVYGFSLGVPQGWSATLGSRDEARRIRLHDPQTDTWVDVRVPESGVTFAPRKGCTWTFQDRARYRLLPGEVLLETGTCMPDDPRERRVFAYVSRLHDQLVVVEVHAPGDQLAAAKRAGDHVVSTYRWREQVRPIAPDPLIDQVGP